MKKSLVHSTIPVKPVTSTSQYPSKKLIRQATEMSNLSQWIQNEIMDYIEDNNDLDLVEVADRIIKQVLEDKNLVNNKIHKEGYKAGYKKCSKKSNFFGGDLLSNCCAWDFDPFGYEKDEGIWQERCLKCKRLCEPLWISKNDIQNIRDCSKWNDEKKS